MRFVMPEVVSDAAADRVDMFERWLRFEPVALAAAMLPLDPNQGLAPPLIFHACGFARQQFSPAAAARSRWRAVATRGGGETYL